MKRFGQWLRTKMQRFMAGRYGSDKLNLLLIGIGFVACIVAMFLSKYVYARLALTAVSYGFLFWSIFRCLSRNTYKRYQENRKFLMLIQRFKDREHRYFDCPRCKQQVRVPRKKGKISITCPKCREKFIRKT